MFGGVLAFSGDFESYQKCLLKCRTLPPAPTIFRCTHSIAACTLHLKGTLNNYHILGNKTSVVAELINMLNKHCIY